MRATIILFGIFILSVINCSVAAQQNDSALKAEFEAKMVAWQKAYNSGDAKNLIPLYTEDAIYTSSHVPGLEAIGREKLIANFQVGISGGGHIDKIEILKMDVSDDLAYLFCKYQATNSGETVSGRNLIVLKKADNTWKIVMHMTVV
jgi:ketosteroid isomerase-like protein